MSLRSLTVCGCAICFVVVLACAQPAMAQGTGAAAAARVTQPINDNNLVTLKGTVHPLARAQYDRGAVADSQPIRRALLLLQRSPAQETALRQLLDNQQSKTSPNYHQWLTPAQFGQQFGPADADVQTVTSWLAAQGFQVNRVSNGRTVIEFSGTAGQVRNAFHTEIHQYAVNGEQHMANASPLQIPAALAPVVAGVASLNDFKKKPLSHVLGVFSKSQATGIVKPVARFVPANSGTGISPTYTFNLTDCSINAGNTSLSNYCYALGPADFDTIYNVPSPLINASPSFDGAGQTIAIVGDSEICTASSPQFAIPAGQGGCGGVDDVKQFRTLFGLPTANLPNVILDGADPGLNFDETEGDLDTEWSGAIAPGATIDFVIAEDTEASSGIDLAAEHIVDNNLAPVLSESFGECEAFLGSGSEFYGELWEQAAAQGITVIISAGDSGSAGCDNENAQATAGLGLNVNAIASTPFNVAAGGTDFDYTAYSTNAQTGSNQYWNAPTGNNSTTEASAKGYIPETTWNDSCAQSFSTLTCAAAGSTSSSLNIVGGGGGQSNCIDPTSQLANGQILCGTAFTVTGVNYPGWPKPSWQPVAGSGSGLTAATDVLRDLPDISLFASDGQTSASFYIVCEQDLDKNDAACSLSNLTTFIGVGGTSSSAPTFAGIMALVNQKTATLTPAITGQGNANYVLYPLYNAQVTANTSCSSSSSPNSLCTFNDVTKGDNSVPCMVGALVGSANCSVSSSGTGDLVFGTTTAWNAVTGFDLATGLGSVNATNLINNWATQVGTFTPTETTLCLVAGSTNSPACSPLPTTLSITHGGVVSGSVTVKNTSNLVLTSLTSTLKQPEDATLLGVVNGTAIPVDRLDSQNADIYPLAAGTITGPLTAELVGGTYAVHAHYAGDGKNGSSDSNVINVTVSPEPSETAVSALLYNFLDASGGESAAFSISSGASVYYGDSILLRTDVFGANSGEENGSGSVTLTDTTTSTILGTYTLNSDGYAENQTGSTVDGLITPPLAVGTHTIQATYTGDASYCPSPTVGGCGTGTSTAFGATFNVASAPTTTTLTASATGVTPGSSITVSSGTNVAVTAFVDTFNTSVLSSGGSSGAFLTGTVTFSVTPSGGATTQTPVNITSSSATFDSDYFVAGVATLNLPTVTATTTVTATFTPGNTNYVTSASTTNATVNVGPTFTISPSTGGGVSDTINISAPGQSGSLPITVNSSGFSGNVTLTCAVAPSNLTDTPGCSFTLSGTANNTVALTGSGSNGQRQLNITTTAASSLPGLLRSPQGLNGSPLPVVTVSLLVFLLFSLSWGMSVRKRRGVALLATLLLVVVAGTISCGGGGSSGGTGTGGGGNSGTTVATYSVTVTATPATGTAQQTTVVLNVN